MRRILADYSLTDNWPVQNGLAAGEFSPWVPIPDAHPESEGGSCRLRCSRLSRSTSRRIPPAKPGGLALVVLNSGWHSGAQAGTSLLVPNPVRDRGGGLSVQGGAGLSEQETKALMDALLGGFREQKAMLDGLTHDLAKLRGEMETFRKEVRQDIADVRQ